MDTVYRYFAALYTSRPVPLLLKESRSVVTHVEASTYLAGTTFNPPLVQVKHDLDNLEDAELTAHHGPKGAIAKRNDALLVVRGDMRQIKSTVQLAADADITHAQAIILSAGMYVSTRAKKGKPDLAARYGGAPGLVILDAKAIKGQGSYQWQMNAGQQGWTDLPPGVKASTVVTGLTPVTVYSFRYRTLTAAGLSDWSSVVTIVAR